MMSRTQISLDPEAPRRARAEAALQGIGRVAAFDGGFAVCRYGPGGRRSLTVAR